MNNLLKYGDIFKNEIQFIQEPVNYGITIKFINTYCSGQNVTNCKKFIYDNISTFALNYEMERLERYVTKSIRRYYDILKKAGSTDTEIREEIESRYAELIDSELLPNWERVYNALFSEYNPIENYRMVENEDKDNHIETNSNITMSGTSSETTANERKFNGFNSSEPKLVESNNGSSSGSNSQTTAGSKESNYSDSNEDRELTRSGNIGITTSQQMIESEVNLRKHKFLNIVYADIDKLLFLSYIG